MTDEPIPCPCCGGMRIETTGNINESNNLGRFGAVWCECGLHMTRKTLEEAIAAWNTRAAVTDGQFAMAVHNGEAWQKVRTCHNIYDGREFRCSECGMQWHLLDRADFGEEWAHVRNPAYCPSCGAKVVE